MKSFLSSLLFPEPLGQSPRLLVLQLNRIGELVLSTPALRSIYETWPRARVTLVLRETSEGLVPMLPELEQTLVLRPRWHQNRTLYRILLTEHFDACLDFTGTDRSALMALCSRAPRRVAFQSAQKGPIRSLIYQHFVQVHREAAHEIDCLHQITRPLGITPPASEPLPTLHVPHIAQQRTLRLLKECGIAGPFALIHPGSAAPEKYWLPERWAEVILSLQHQHHLPCVLTGGADPFEQDHLRAIQTALAMLGQGSLPFPLVKLAGQLDLTLLTALLQQARLVVSCDTACIHLASAFKRPQVTLFGPTNPFQWRPRHPDSLLVCAALPDASPLTFSPDFPTAPMAHIQTRSVLRACQELLERSAPPPPLP